jgi:hypothetical protein
LDDHKDLAEITEVERLLLCSTRSSSKTRSRALRQRSNLKKPRIIKRRNPTPPTVDDGCMAPHAISLSSAQFGGMLNSAIKTLHNAIPVIFIAWLLGVIAGLDARFVQPVITPFCSIPGLAHTSMCSSIPMFGDRTSSQADFPSLVESQCWKVDSLLEDSAAASTLASEAGNATSATKDLLDLIYTGDLESNVALMSFSRDVFTLARRSSYRLHHLHNTILHLLRRQESFFLDCFLLLISCGTIISTREDNDHALRTIEITTTKPTSYMGSLYHWLWSNPSALLTQTYKEAVDLHMIQLNPVVTAAEKAFADLEDLLARVDTMLDIFKNEGVAVSGNRADLLVDLWILLGASRKKTESFDANLLLLKGLVTHWDDARWHTRRALDTVLSIQADVARLTVDRTLNQNTRNGSIPVDLHIESLRKGMERLETSLAKIGSSH